MEIRNAKIFYFNDRKRSAWVTIGSLGGPVVELKPAQGKVFEVPLEEDAVPWIKVWENNQVMLGGVSADLVENLDVLNPEDT